MATQDPEGDRQDAERRLRYLKYGAVGVTLAGIGAFTGLAVAATSSGPDHAQGDHADRHGSASGEDRDHDGRVGDPGDGGYFDDQGYGGAVGPGPGAAQGSGPDATQGYGDGYGYSDPYGQSQAPQGGYGQGGGGSMPSQGSSGAS